MSARPDATASALQHAFAAHLRDPAHAPAPRDIEPRRMAVYTELFFNNIESLISANFPVIRTLYADDAWHEFVRAFYRDHRSHTPLFTDIAREFIRHLEARADANAGDPPFLGRARSLRMVRARAFVRRNRPRRRSSATATATSSTASRSPRRSRACSRIAFRSHRISADFRPSETPPQPTLILLDARPRRRAAFPRDRRADRAPVRAPATEHDTHRTRVPRCAPDRARARRARRSAIRASASSGTSASATRCSAHGPTERPGRIGPAPC